MDAVSECWLKQILGQFVEAWVELGLFMSKEVVRIEQTLIG